MSSVLLLSGGMDSIAVAHWLRPEFAVTVDYGQRSAEGEIRAASAVAGELGLTHFIETVNIRALGSGDLAGSPSLSIASIPEWWPFRNQFLLTIAGMRAAALNAERLLIGCVSSDSMHADGTAWFVESISRLMQLQEGAIAVDAPAIGMTTAQLIRTSKIPFELLAWAHSCHSSDFACGQCRGCRKHYSIYTELDVAAY